MMPVIKSKRQTLLACFGHKLLNKIAKADQLKGKQLTDKYTRVKIVGAGCGDVELLTIKAAKAITEADALVYDNLVSDEIIGLASNDCTLHYMGKRFGHKSSTQDEINATLYQLALSGVKVVRLKGGDPNVFGRGSEEAQFLAKRGVRSEFIAGVTAALGCAASAAIPLTHRQIARSVTFVTGRTCDESAIEWRDLLAANSTLVFYMGKEKAAEIAAGLMSAGAEGDLSVALITNGGRAAQSVIYTKVSKMEFAANNITQQGPTLIIVGEVVSLSEELQQWFTHCEPVEALEYAYG